jgi:hypothetical protein
MFPNYQQLTCSVSGAVTSHTVDERDRAPVSGTQKHTSVRQSYAFHFTSMKQNTFMVVEYLPFWMILTLQSPNLS